MKQNSRKGKMTKKFNHEYYDQMIMEDYKQKLILEKKREIQELKKRIKLLELELDGMGISIQNI